MALRAVILMIILLFSLVQSVSNAPFPQGYQMTTQGTIQQDDWIASREPWSPALLVNTERKFGFSIGATSFYDRMDNLESRSIYAVYGGGWTQINRFRINLAISQFDAFGIYQEQHLSGSFGAHFFKNARFSLNLCGYRTGLQTGNRPCRTRGDAGLSALYKFKVVSVAASVGNVPLKHSGGAAADPGILLKFGLHTRYNRIGAQGLILSISPDAEQPVRFMLGEEFRFNDQIAFNISVSNTPVFVGIGFSAQIRSLDASVGLITNPDLGWSRGVAFSYSK